MWLAAERGRSRPTAELCIGEAGASLDTTSTTINYCTVGYEINYLSGCSEALELWRKQMMYYLPDIFISRR